MEIKEKIVAGKGEERSSSAQKVKEMLDQCESYSKEIKELVGFRLELYMCDPYPTESGNLKEEEFMPEYFHDLRSFIRVINSNLKAIKEYFERAEI